MRQVFIAVAMLLTGCATVPTDRHASSLHYAERFASSGEYLGAFNFIKSTLATTRPEDAQYRAKAIEFVRANKDVLAAGKDSATPDSYLFNIEKYGENRAKADITESINALATLLPKEEIEKIRAEIQQIQIKGKALYVSALIYEQLSAKEAATLKEKYFVRVVSAKEAGLIVDRQVANESAQGSTAGSQLGAAVGSATYVDRAFAGNPSNWNYSAKGHVGAQVLGAVIGGALADTSATSAYSVRYAIRHLDGSRSYQLESSSSPFGHSVGTCVSIKNLTLLPQEVCELDSPAFRNRYLR